MLIKASAARNYNSIANIAISKKGLKTSQAHHRIREIKRNLCTFIANRFMHANNR